MIFEEMKINFECKRVPIEIYCEKAVFFVIKKDNHFLFLILTTDPVFIKHKTQGLF